MDHPSKQAALNTQQQTFIIRNQYAISHGGSMKIMRSWTDYIYNHMYVDKSLIIKSITSIKQPLIIITRPQSSGKTFNLQMIKSFFQFPVEVNHGRLNLLQKKFQTELFYGLNDEKFQSYSLDYESYKKSKIGEATLNGLKIRNYGQVAKYFSNYIVLQLNFSCKESKFELNKYLSSIIKQVANLVQRHQYLQKDASFKSGYTYYILGLNQLSKSPQSPKHVFQKLSLTINWLIITLYNYHKKQIIILVDQYICVQGEVHLYASEEMVSLEIPLKQLIITLLAYEEYIYKLIFMGVKDINIGYQFQSKVVHETVDQSEMTSQNFGFSPQQLDLLLESHFKKEYKKQLNQCVNWNIVGKRYYSSSIINSILVILMSVDTKGFQLHGFWPRHQRLLFNYLNYMSLENLRSFNQLIKTYIHNQLQVIKYQDIANFRQRALSFPSDFLSYSQIDMITFLIMTGYLIKSQANSFMIANKQISCYLESNFFRDQFQSLVSQKAISYCSQLPQKRFRLEKWNSCRRIIQNAIKNKLEVIKQPNQAVFSALILSQITQRVRGQYIVEFQKIAENKKRADFIFLPLIASCPVIIIQNKFAEKYQKINQKLQQAHFQILQKNYFGQALRQSQDCAIIMRALVSCLLDGHKNIQLHEHDFQLSRNFASLVCQYCKLLLCLDPMQKAKKFKDVVKPYQLQEFDKTIQFLVQLQKRSTIQIFAHNKMLIQQCMQRFSTTKLQNSLKALSAKLKIKYFIRKISKPQVLQFFTSNL